MPLIYISGPMSGLPDSNYPAFDAAAAAWTAAGWDVDNPADHFGRDQNKKYIEYVEVDIDALKQCDAIAMLPGWDSPTARGSIWERQIAVQFLNLPVLDATKPVAPWSPANDPRGGEIIVDYDEYRALQKRANNAVVSMDDPLLAAFIDAVIPTPVSREQPPQIELSVKRHPLTGALGRWL